MEEIGGKGKLHLKTAMLGKSSSRNNSPSFRRLNSSRTPRKDFRASFGSLPWMRNNRVVFWLILITLWAYIGFHVQSQWAHSDHSKAEFIGYKSGPNVVAKTQKFEVKAPSNITKEPLDSKVNVGIVRKVRQVKKGRRTRLKKGIVKPVPVVENRTEETQGMDDGIMMMPRKNTSYGVIVGPFRETEESVLGWSAEKRKGTCNRRGEFARIVWSRRFVLVFHELSMTGAPLSMMELGTEILSCGGTVSAVVLSKRGGLMGEIERRGIKVMQDRAEHSYKAAMKADIVIAGSAVCSNWIEPYLTHYPAASSQVVWWIMENRREYFDRSKHMLNRVKMLTFLSDSQSKQWLSWCEEEKIQLASQPMLVPLSVNDELAFVAGLPCSLNTPAFSVDKMMEKRDLLRSAVRKEMGLNDHDMLVMSLSSINPGKGQRLFLEAALLVSEHNVSHRDPKNYGLLEEKDPSEVASQNQTTMNSKQPIDKIDEPTDVLHKSNSTRVRSNKKKKRTRSRVSNVLSSAKQIKAAAKGEQQTMRNLLSEGIGSQEETLKVLIGSIGSKSNKLLYVKAILRFLSQHSNLSKIVLWSPATTHVASLYAAADVYVINAQGPGETFGRVTIEAMAFGLPVLGTDAGGTREIVDPRVTGLLHPLGHEGIETLAQNVQYLLSNPLARKKMGMNGRRKVQDKYLKHHTYEKFAKVLAKCMKPK